MSLRAFRRAVVISAALFALASVTTAGAFAAGYRFNTSDSIPVGVYRLTGQATYRPGSVVVFCPPDSRLFQGARNNGYLAPGFCPHGYAPLFKPVAAGPGDTVRASRAGLEVNGLLLRNTRSYRADARGNLLPRIAPGSYSVSPGQVWLVSTHNPASFDSRYFGPVDRSELRGELAPVWIQEGRR